MQAVARPVRTRGFSLIELAVALVVIALLLGSILVPLTTQIGQRRTTDTQKALEDIKEALIGFALAQRRLPCPASAASNGVESPDGGGACTNPYNGFVPAATLGLASTDAQGYAIDAWGARIRYAVSSANTNAFTTSNGMRSVGLTALAPDLWVCPSGAGITAADCGGAANPYLANSAVAVIYSLGPNWATGGTSSGESANPNPNSVNNDRVFVFRVRADPGTAGGEFDDIVTWLSPNILYSRMVAAGQLP